MKKTLLYFFFLLVGISNGFTQNQFKINLQLEDFKIIKNISILQNSTVLYSFQPKSENKNSIITYDSLAIPLFSIEVECEKDFYTQFYLDTTNLFVKINAKENTFQFTNSPLTTKHIINKKKLRNISNYRNEVYKKYNSEKSDSAKKILSKEMRFLMDSMNTAQHDFVLQNKNTVLGLEFYMIIL